MKELVMLVIFTLLSSICILANPLQGHALSLAGERETSIQKRDPFVPPTLGITEREQAVKESDRHQQKGAVKEREKKGKEKVAVKKDPPPPIILTGVVMGQAGNRAIVFDRDKKVTHLVTVGMKMGSYLVTAIAPGLVVMTNNSRSLHLQIGSKN